MESANPRPRLGFVGAGPSGLVAGAFCVVALMATPVVADAESLDARQDFRGLAPAASFAATIDALKIRDPFTAHKGIDGERGRATYRPAMVAANPFKQSEVYRLPGRGGCNHGLE